MDSIIDRISELLSQLQSPDFYAREEAVKELGTYDQDEAVAGLIMALEDPDLGIRELAADYLTQIKGDTASQLLIRFLANEDIGTRNLSAEILVRIGKDAVPALLSEIDNDDHDVRKFIVDVLGLIKDESSVEAICGKLKDSNINVVCSAAEALGEIGSSRAIKALVEAYQSTEDVRLQAVEALGKIGDPSAQDYLVKMLDNQDPMILFAAIEALGNIGQRDVVGNLKNFLESEDRSIAEAAMSSIISISMQHGGKTDCDLPLDNFTDFLFEGIKNKNKKVTQFTLSRLSRWYGNNVLNSLIDVLEYVDDDNLKDICDVLAKVGPSASTQILERLPHVSSKVKLTLINILKQYIDDEIADKLTTYINDTDPEIRRNIAYVLGVLASSQTIEPLKRLTRDNVGHVRSAAYAALGWSCTEEETDFLFEGLKDKFPDVREAVMGALIIVGGDKVVNKFNEDLYSEDMERQRLAANALGMIGDSNVVEPLLQALNHPEPTIRKSVIDSLAKIKEVENINPLLMSLNDENSAVRKAAASSLIAIKGDSIIPDLRFLLDDDDVWVRYHMINLIGDLANPKYCNYIFDYLDSDDDIIKIATIKALSRMGCKDALPQFSKLRSEKNTDIVEAAEMAINNLQG